jgi:hypothetical protein
MVEEILVEVIDDKGERTTKNVVIDMQRGL